MQQINIKLAVVGRFPTVLRLSAATWGKAVFRWEKEIEKNWWKLGLAPEEFTNNREVVMTAIKQDAWTLQNMAYIYMAGTSAFSQWFVALLLGPNLWVLKSSPIWVELGFET